VVRDHNGRVVVGKFFKIMANSVVVAEAWAMCEAAFLLYSLHARPVILEEDLTSHFPWEISSTCHDISEYLGYQV
jgi:hypothetical protein